MRWAVLGVLLFSYGETWAQDGQRLSHPGWPCVPGRAVDPSYLELSESTGGQLFLFQKNEVQHSSLVMTAPSTHPVTVLRAVGQLSGTKVFDFPVDSTIESMLVSASVQCRQSVTLNEPAGAEIAPARASKNVDLQAGRIVQVDQPSFGAWRLQLSGYGLYVFSVQVKSKIRFSVSDAENGLRVEASGFEGPTQVWELSASGEKSAGAQRYRLAVEGKDELGYPVLRTHPVLFKRKAKVGLQAFNRAALAW